MYFFISFLIYSFSMLTQSQTNLITNGDFSISNCNSAYCLWNITTFKTTYVPGWTPNPEIQVGKGKVYNSRFTNQNVSELAVNKNTCIRQNITNLTSGNYTISLVYAARDGRQFGDCVFTVKANGTILQTITPTDYLIHNMSYDFILSKNMTTYSIQLCGSGKYTDNSYGALVTNITVIKQIVKTNASVGQNKALTNPSVQQIKNTVITNLSGITTQIQLSPNIIPSIPQVQSILSLQTNSQLIDNTTKNSTTTTNSAGNTVNAPNLRTETTQTYNISAPIQENKTQLIVSAPLEPTIVQISSKSMLNASPTSNPTVEPFIVQNSSMPVLKSSPTTLTPLIVQNSSAPVLKTPQTLTVEPTIVQNSSTSVLKTSPTTLTPLIVQNSSTPVLKTPQTLTVEPTIVQNSSTPVLKTSPTTLTPLIVQKFSTPVLKTIPTSNPTVEPMIVQSFSSPVLKTSSVLTPLAELTISLNSSSIMSSLSSQNNSQYHNSSDIKQNMIQNGQFSNFNCSQPYCRISQSQARPSTWSGEFSIGKNNYLNTQFPQSSGYGLYLTSSNSECVTQTTTLEYGVYQLQFAWASTTNNNKRMETGMFLIKLNGKLLKVITPLDYNVHNQTVIVQAVKGKNTLQFCSFNLQVQSTIIYNYGSVVDNITLYRLSQQEQKVSLKHNFIINGDFQSNLCSERSCIYNSNQTSIQGWKTTTQIQIGVGLKYNKHAGNTMLIQLDANQNSCISQVVQNCIIGMYELHFRWGANQNSPLLDSIILLKVNGQIKKSLIGTDSLMHRQSILVSVSGQQTNVQFCSYGHSNGYGAVIDDVQMYLIQEC